MGADEVSEVSPLASVGSEAPPRYSWADRRREDEGGQGDTSRGKAQRWDLFDRKYQH